VTPEQTLSYIVANIRPGTKVPVEILRDGKSLTLAAIVGTRPAEDKVATKAFDPKQAAPFTKDPAPQASGKLLRDLLGFAVIPLTADIAGDIGIDPATKGVVITSVSPSSDAAQRGFQRGDVIMGANYKATPDIDSLAAQIAQAKKAGRTAVMLQVRRQGLSNAQVAVRLSE
jgi:serine protease Do